MKRYAKVTLRETTQPGTQGGDTWEVWGWFADGCKILLAENVGTQQACQIAENAKKEKA